MFAAQSLSNELLIFSITISLDVDGPADRYQIKLFQIQESSKLFLPDPQHKSEDIEKKMNASGVELGC